MKLLVCFDLAQDERNLDVVRHRLRQAQGFELMRGVWLVATDGTLEQAQNDFFGAGEWGPEDRFLITPVGNEFAWFNLRRGPALHVTPLPDDPAAPDEDR
jgi:hypothetical protein